MKKFFELKDKDDLLFLILLFIAIFMRFYGLDFQSLWNDELASWQNATLPTIKELISRVKKFEPHPIGYWLFLKYFIKVFGDSETALRIPTAICGSGVVLMVYILASKYFNKTTALLAVAFNAFVVFPLHYSQMARGNIYVTFTMLVSFYYLLELFYNKNYNKKNFILYILITLLSIFSHYSALFVFCGQSLVAFILSCNKKDDFKKFFLTYLVITILYLPQLFMMYYQATHMYEVDCYFRFGWEMIEMYVYFVSGMKPSLYFISPILLLAFFYSLFCFFAWILKSIKQKEAIKDPLICFIIFGFSGLVITFIATYLGQNLFSGKNNLPSVPLVHIIMAVFVTKFITKKVVIRSIALIVATLTIYETVFVRNYYSSVVLPNWRDAIAKMSELNKEYKTDKALICQYGEFYRYYQKQHSNLPNTGGNCFGFFEKPVEILDKITKEDKNSPVWLMETEHSLKPEFYEQIIEKYDIILHEEFNNFCFTWPEEIKIMLVKRKKEFM